MTTLCKQLHANEPIFTLLSLQLSLCPPLLLIFHLVFFFFVQIQGCFGACGPCLIGYLWRKEAHSLTSHSKTSTHTNLLVFTVCLLWPSPEKKISSLVEPLPLSFPGLPPLPLHCHSQKDGSHSCSQLRGNDRSVRQQRQTPTYTSYFILLQYINGFDYLNQKVSIYNEMKLNHIPLYTHEDSAPDLIRWNQARCLSFQAISIPFPHSRFFL